MKFLKLKMYDDLPGCPFCGAIPIKEGSSSSDGYWINHNKDCFLRVYARLAGYQIEQWLKRELVDVALINITAAGLEPDVEKFNSKLKGIKK